jgi:hypothetical protein
MAQMSRQNTKTAQTTKTSKSSGLKGASVKSGPKTGPKQNSKSAQLSKIKVSKPKAR